MVDALSTDRDNFEKMAKVGIEKFKLATQVAYWRHF